MCFSLIIPINGANNVYLYMLSSLPDTDFKGLAKRTQERIGKEV